MADFVAQALAFKAISNSAGIEKLPDVDITNPENGEVLKYDAEQGKWINGTASGGGGTSDYTDLTNKPKINGVTLSGNKSLADIGAADADDVYTKTESDTLFSAKVDKVSGKGLSENDYTTAEKTKLEGIESGAEVNVQPNWAQTDAEADDYIKNKPTIPAAQIPSDWNATQGVSRILNKPTLGNAANKNYTAAVTAQSNDLVTSGAVHTAISDNIAAIKDGTSIDSFRDVETALAGKQATLTTEQQAAADSGITSAKVAQYDKDSAALPKVVDDGAKNLSPVDNVIFTRPTGAAYTDPISIDLRPGEYVVQYKLTTTANAAVAITYDGSEHTFYDSNSPYSDTVVIHTFTVVNSGTSFRFYFNQAATVSELMICSKAEWDVSNTYVPYAPTNRELYEMILALQNGGNG